VGRQLADDVHAFTIGFGDRGYDEAPAARRVAEFLKLRHTERRLDERQIAWSLDEIGALIDEPFADSSLIPTYFVSLSARQDVTVALSGDGGDELFCGYAKYRHLRHGLRLMCAPQLVRAFAAAAAAACPWDGVAKAATALRSESTADLMRWLVSVWKPDELRELMPDVIVDWEETEFCRALGRFAHREPLAALMAADVRAYLCDDILQKVDRASMAVSLELRSPLLDYRIVEFACRLPLSLKLRNGEQKYVLKKLLERYVPRPLWDRPKQGFKAPMKELYRERSDDEMHAAIDRLCHTFGDVLRPVAMRRVLEDHRKGRRDYSQKLYSLEVLSRWCEMQS